MELDANVGLAILVMALTIRYLVDFAMKALGKDPISKLARSIEDLSMTLNMGAAVENERRKARDRDLARYFSTTNDKFMDIMGKLSTVAEAVPAKIDQVATVLHGKLDSIRDKVNCPTK